MTEPVSLDKVREARDAAKAPKKRAKQPPTPPSPPTGADAPAACPITPLGHRAGSYVFLDVMGQERSLTARQLGQRMDLSSLFGGDTGWLKAQFPHRQLMTEIAADGTESKVERVVGYRTAPAGEWLMAECTRAGIWGDALIIRRPGIWQGPDGAPIVHCGDAVLMDGSEHPAGLRLGNALFAADSATPRPAAACGPEVAAAIVRDMAELWRWRQPGGEILAMGLLGAGLLGAAARWRPNGFIIGGPGSGKSKLLGLMMACAPVSFQTNDTTKEGISQAVNRRAMPIFVDEASDRADRMAAQALMDLVLAATGDGGARAFRGTSDGRGRSVEVLGVITMASVAPPDMQAQHVARFTMLELVKPDGGADNSAAMAAATERARAAGPGLWGRMLAGWSRWTQALETYRSALGRAGCAPREMDQIGALLASWWVLVDDDVPTERQALDGVHAVTNYARRAEEVAEVDGSRLAVQHLLSSKITRNHTTDQVPIGELILQAFDGGDAASGDQTAANTHLIRHGIRVIRAEQLEDKRGFPVPRGGSGDGVWFATTARPLSDLFRGSSFEGSRWRFSILQLESARKSARNVRFGALACPGIWVSRKCLLVESDP